MRKVLRRLALVLVPAMLLAGPVAAADDASPFTAEQKAAIETLVREYLLAHPEMLLEMTDALEAKQKAEAQAQAQAGITEHRDQIFRSEDDFVLNPDGAIPVVEFFDYNCGYCKKLLPTMRRLQAEEDDLRIVFKELPILSEESIQAARVAIAAKRQGKYMELHNVLMAQRGRVDGQLAMRAAEDLGLDMQKLKADLHSPEVGAEITANRQLAETLGIRGTPTLLVGETLIPGALPYERIMEVVEERRESCAVC